MIRFWFLLLVLIRLSQQNQTGVSSCGPQNLTVSRSDQTVLVEWEDDPSCSALNDPILYNMTVLVENQEVHSDGVWVAPGHVGSTHSWRWTSPLPMDCAAHTFRLRAQIQNQTSRLDQERTLPDKDTFSRNVFPQDALLEAGSSATFCCIVPHGQQFGQMYLDGNTGNTTKISEHRYALTVRLKPVMESGADVHCETKSGEVHGASVFIGYPPGDEDLRCETRDLESVECRWNKGRNTMVEVQSRTRYELDGSPCVIGSELRCSKEVNIGGGERNWTLTAQNVFGKVEIQDSADLTRRVHMFAPHDLGVGDVEARSVRLSWSWTVQRYHNLSLNCQMIVSDADGSSLQIKHGVGLKAAVLTDLRPNWKYEVKVRCRTAQHFWTWSDWSSRVSFLTEGDVPDALDVWMQRKGSQTAIVWKKLLANQSHGDVTGYHVTWTRTRGSDQLHKEEVNASVHEYTLDGDSVVTVTAKNQHGSSPPSTITVPPTSPDETSMNLSCFTGSDGGLDLSWSHHPEASCGYMVDWFPALEGDRVDWLKLPPSQNRVRIKPKNDVAGRRYSVSIYACTGGAPLLLERKDGFFTEKQIQPKLFQPLSYKLRGSDVEIYWDPVPLREQPACIHGYVLYYFKNRGEPISVTTENPADSSLTARNLQSGSYTFIMAAQTAGGAYGNTTLQVLLNDEDDLSNIFISMGAVFILLFLITVLCYRHWACIKEKFYPDIPKPNMADWFTSPEKRVNPYLQSGLGCHGEENLAVPELLLKPAELLNNNNTDQEDTALTSQAPPLYQNNPAQSRHAVSTVFPNLTYNLPAADPERPADPGRPAGLEPNDYHPQTLAEVFGQNRAAQKPVICVSEYIMALQ
ncbi:leukemia inhibitory factor receptor-like [Xiphophorus maculatus]|uniref:Leukemia inhibitory factor receptor-like n=2 Tax=Xiphophorus maculatus TaxID=8083 RepID=M3ZNW6_XIPMA|nr:leukemia inhibitory factor receptor-like [Xiphophorus maculatus]XP_023193529.1 leukemia inhibitory factor receptor-like [Xiphophorus maculatus]